jgi:hypothetical protein
LGIIPEGENPASLIGRINSCYAESLQDKINHNTMLAFAMLQALPKSFSTIKQALWLRTPLKHADVSAAVQAEWSRRASGEENIALKARLQAGKGFIPKPGDGAVYCDVHKTTNHSNAQCFSQGAPKPVNYHNHNNKNRSNTPKASIATRSSVGNAEDHTSSLAVDNSDDKSPQSYVAQSGHMATYIVILEQPITGLSSLCFLLMSSRVQRSILWLVTGRRCLHHQWAL